MHTFTQKPTVARQAESAKTTKPARAHFAQSHAMGSILKAHDRTSSHTARIEDLEANSIGDPATLLGHAFGSILSHAMSCARIQPKLKVSTQRDVYEQEADRVADEVLRPRVSENDKTVESVVRARMPRHASQRKYEVDENLEHSINNSQGRGNPIPPALRNYFEPRMQFDFSKIRVHTTSEAARMNQSLGARAFTRSSDIYFGQGQYNPRSIEGRRLLAHELTHVIQQGSVPAISSDVIQGSFVSWVFKMGAKQASKGMLKNFIKTQIKSRIKKLTIKKFAKRFAKEADQLLDILEDPWWVTAIGLIPVVGDAFDLVRVPKQIKKAMDKADALEDKVKRILSIQGQWAEKLIPASLKRSESYFDDLAQKSYAELVDMASRDSRAAKMKKLIEQQHRLMEKL